MKTALIAALFVSCFFTLSSQSAAFNQKFYAKINKDSKFFITEKTYLDGHREQVIRQQKLGSNESAVGYNIAFPKNKIPWNANTEREGQQSNLATHREVNLAFNNALAQMEVSNKLSAESLGRMKLSADFSDLTPADQSATLVAELAKLAATWKNKGYISFEAKPTNLENVLTEITFLTTDTEGRANVHLEVIYDQLFNNSSCRFTHRDQFIALLSHVDQVHASNTRAFEEFKTIQSINSDPTVESGLHFRLEKNGDKAMLSLYTLDFKSEEGIAFAE